MKSNALIALLFGLFATAWWMPIGTALAQPADQAAPDETITVETITVQTASGRSFTAVLDRQTDVDRLWLRWERKSVVVRRPIDWDRVEQVHVAGKVLSGEEFLDVVRAVRQENPFREEAARTKPRVVVMRTMGSAVAAGRTPPHAPVPDTPRVCSLAIEATLVNWDSDVEADGLVVHVYPLDGYGDVVPVRGTLNADLTAERVEIVKRPQPFHTIGRWTRQVSQDDFGPHGAAFRLPFQGVHPEFDLSAATFGLVHARLSVPGQGTFEATADTVRIRAASPVRDRLEQFTGRRFFPQERIGRGPPRRTYSGFFIPQLCKMSTLPIERSIHPRKSGGLTVFLIIGSAASTAVGATELTAATG